MTPRIEGNQGKVVKPIVEINLEKCTGCGECVEWCPPGAVQLEDGVAILSKPENCQYCTDCETICPTGAIRCPFEIILISKPEVTQKQ